MRYRRRTLLIVLALGPPLITGCYFVLREPRFPAQHRRQSSDSRPEELCRRGQVPQAGNMEWARVVLTVAENGRQRQVLRVPITVDRQVPLIWQPGGLQ